MGQLVGRWSALAMDGRGGFCGVLCLESAGPPDDDFHGTQQHSCRLTAALFLPNPKSPIPNLNSLLPHRTAAVQTPVRVTGAQTCPARRKALYRFVPAYRDYSTRHSLFESHKGKVSTEDGGIHVSNKPMNILIIILSSSFHYLFFTLHGQT